jgi:hypothetical protein
LSKIRVRSIDADTYSAETEFGKDPNSATTPQNASSVVVGGCTINGVPATAHEIIGIFRAAWAKRDADASEWEDMYYTLKLELEVTRTALQKTEKELKAKKGHIRTLKRAIEVQK